jgi:HNH endonuclease
MTMIERVMQINPLDAAAALSDHELLRRVKKLAADERHATAHLVAHLAEVDARRLYLGEGCSSLFTYCTQVLHLSEHAAYGRIEAARAARKFPRLLDAIASGALHLTAVTLIAPHLTPENVQRVIDATTHKTKRDVEEFVAALRPQPLVASSVRKLQQARQCATIHEAPAAQIEPAVQGRETADSVRTDTAGQPPDSMDLQVPVQPAAHATIKPLAPEQYLVKFTASRATHEKLREAQALLRHQVPSGDVAEILDRALTLLLAKLRRDRHAASSKPRATHRTSNTGRHVAAAVKREVWARDGGQCAFVGASGRCTERGFLEYHHVIPFADGGKTDASNLQLRCRAHNGYEAERWSGPREEDLLREVSASYGVWGSPVSDGLRARRFDASVEPDSVQTGHLKNCRRHVPGGASEPGRALTRPAVLRSCRTGQLNQSRTCHPPRPPTDGWPILGIASSSCGRMARMPRL